MISFLTSLSLNRIKDFPDYYKCEITSAASPWLPPPPPRADHGALESIFLWIRGATVHKLIQERRSEPLRRNENEPTIKAEIKTGLREDGAGDGGR